MKRNFYCTALPVACWRSYPATTMSLLQLRQAQATLTALGMQKERVHLTVVTVPSKAFNQILFLITEIFKAIKYIRRTPRSHLSKRINVPHLQDVEAVTH